MRAEETSRGVEENAEVTENHYLAKHKGEKGVNWSYFAKRAQATIGNPLHSRDESVERAARRVDAVATHRTSTQGNSNDVEMSAVSVSTQGTNVCDMAMAENPSWIILNKPNLEQALLPDGKPKIVSEALLSVQDLIKKFKSLAEDPNGRNCPEFWVLSSKAATLGRVKLLGNDDTPVAELKVLYQHLFDLMVLHASLTMNCSVNDVLDRYSETVGYYFNNEVLLLAEVNRRASGETFVDV